MKDNTLETNLESDEGIDLDDPIVKLFRQVRLEAMAKEQGSKLYCPDCGMKIPYTQMTIGQQWDGTDANGDPAKKIVYRCTICEKDFYEEDLK